MIAPVVELMARPVGRPVAAQVRVAPDWVSVADGVRVVMAEPDTLDLAPGLVTETVLVMVQAKLVVPEFCGVALSVTVTVTDEVPGVDGVPVMAPVPLLMARPAGRPLAA